MNDQQPGATSNGNSPALSLISAVIGGAIVAVVFAILIATGVVGGKETTVVQQGVATATSGKGNLKTVNSIYKQSAPGVVSIKTKVSASGNDLFGTKTEGTASGTGVVISKDGYIVTNAHVVANNEGDPTVEFSDNKTVDAKIVGRDASNDIAVLKVDSKDHDLSPLQLGDSADVEVGSPVVAIGNPFGLNQTVTSGIVSALQRSITAPNNFTISNVIQTDAAINPGNSGGPLLDATGKVIGINSQIATSGNSEGNVGIGFAVPIDTVKKIIPQLEKSGKVDYAYLGVTTTTLTPDISGKINFGGEKDGALVQCVVKSGPAAKAGMSAGSDTATIDGQQLNIDGDLIVKIDGKAINSSEDVQNAVLAKQVGDEVEITVIRGGKQKELSAKLGSRPSNTNNNCNQQAAQAPQSP
ncbi:MAG: S1C family serine protease [Solirubrobacterales bacterium]